MYNGDLNNDLVGRYSNDPNLFVELFVIWCMMYDVWCMMNRVYMTNTVGFEYQKHLNTKLFEFQISNGSVFKLLSL